MRIVSWNVNSVRAREERLLAWLERHAPDVLCLQELKVVDEDFPRAAVEALGYDVETHGQKTYNGVAILARKEHGGIFDVERGLPDAPGVVSAERAKGAETDPPEGAPDEQARFIAGTVAGIRVASLYVPNGKAMDSPKYPYKRRWMARMQRWLEQHADVTEPLAVCGDFNVARDARDVHDESEWEGGVLYNPDVRAALEGWLDAGLADSFREHTAEGGHYSWWDYRRLAFPRGVGMRIDYVLASEPLLERLVDAWIDRDERKGSKPSDHAPMVADFDWDF
jgi:exodeoxyribonuclease-3